MKINISGKNRGFDHNGVDFVLWWLTRSSVRRYIQTRVGPAILSSVFQVNRSTWQNISVTKSIWTFILYIR